jgi:hypothetical protein
MHQLVQSTLTDRVRRLSASSLRALEDGARPRPAAELQL